MALSNDVSVRHHPNNNANQSVTMVFKECLKNHMATSGGYVLDGCCEFMPSSKIISDDFSSIKCAACGCHRNFHHGEPKEPTISPVVRHGLEYQTHHHNHPPLPPPHHTTNFASPQPISTYPPTPNMVYTGDTPQNVLAPSPTQCTIKRFRTKFTLGQKEKMYEFSKKVGWKIKKLNKEVVKKFCNEIGVTKDVFLVWMHNNKNTFRKKDNVNVNHSSIDINGVNDNDNIKN